MDDFDTSQEDDYLDAEAGRVGDIGFSGRELAEDDS